MNILKQQIKTSGMTCTSCEGRIEREIKKLSGIVNVKANYETENVYVEFDSDKCSIDQITESIKKAGYDIKSSSSSSSNSKIFGIVLAAAVVFLLGRFTGGFDMSSKLAEGTTYFVLFVVGLFTSIHCVGMCGGIMMSQTITADGSSKFAALKPALLYNAGRLISYTVLGGIVGALGSVISVSLGFKSGVMVFAGIFMVIMGLNMAGMNVLRKLHIRLPWSSCSVKSRARTPFVVGLLNGFMPCGPLQTMQLYALGAGSAFKGAASMFIFALGTIPLMLTFGMLTGLLAKGYTKKILKFSGILVVVLGLIMSNRGLALAGITLPTMGSLMGGNISSSNSSVKAEIQDGVQIIRMSANYSGYQPNVLYVQKGMPVKWIINGEQITSCNNSIVIPSLDKQVDLKKGETIIEFTPGDKDINFSCWMGMIRGVIKVVDNLESYDTAKDAGSVPAPSTPSCCSGSAPVGGSSAPQTESIYGSDIGKVETERLVKKATMSNNIQSISIAGKGYEFDPVIVVINKNINTKFMFDLTEYDYPDEKFDLIDGETGDTLTSFEAKAGNVEVKYNFEKSGAYGITQGNSLVGVIEVVDDINNADLQQIREKYINQE